MNFTIITCDQRTPEWFAARCGRLTASRAGHMMAFKRPTVTPTGKPSKAQAEEFAARKHLRTQLVLERLTGKSQDTGWQSQAMKDGIEREPDALLLYEALTGQIVTRTGFLQHTSLMVGASLDGHIGDFDGLAECKCPMASTHLEYLETGKVPGDYLHQITHQLWITGAPWCDWLSYQPDFPEALQVKIVRVHRDEALIAAYAEEARTFLAEVDRKVAALQTSMNLTAQLQAVVA